MLYELFSGVRRDLGSAIPPAVVNHYLPVHINDAIAKCLEPNPEDRFQSMTELKAALAHDPSIGSRGQVSMDVARKRFSTWVLLAGFCVLIGVLELIVYLVNLPPARGHEDKINALAFSPDGRILASGSEDKTIVLWDAVTRHRIRTLTDHIRAVTTLAFSGDSRFSMVGFWYPKPHSQLVRLVKTGGRLVKHARYYWLMLAESHLTRRLFGSMVRRIDALAVATG